MIGRQQAHAFGDHAVAVVIGIAGEGDVEAVLQADQANAWRRARRGPCGCGRPNRGS